MSSFIAVRALRNAINNGSAPWKNSFTTSSCAPSSKKSSGGSSSGSSSKTTGPSSSSSDPSLKVADPPSFVFKKVDGPLGPGASKSSNYKNPEYFTYHEMTYADLDVVMAKYRLPQPSSLKK